MVLQKEEIELSLKLEELWLLKLVFHCYFGLKQSIQCVIPKTGILLLNVIGKPLMSYWKERKPYISYFHVIGYVFYILNQRDQHSKFKEKLMNECSLDTTAYPRLLEYLIFLGKLLKKQFMVPLIRTHSFMIELVTFINSEWTYLQSFIHHSWALVRWRWFHSSQCWSINQFSAYPWRSACSLWRNWIINSGKFCLMIEPKNTVDALKETNWIKAM